MIIRLIYISILITLLIVYTHKYKLYAPITSGDIYLKRANSTVLITREPDTGIEHIEAASINAAVYG